MQPGDDWPYGHAAVEAVVSGVADALERDLAAIAKRDPDLAESALAAVARSLAADVDNLAISATQRAGAARALADTLVQLRELAPKAEGGDRLDELASRRSNRRKRTG